MHSDFLEYNFENQKFEGIFAKAFIHLFPKDDAITVLSKIKDPLVENGIVFITTTIHEKPEEGYYKKEDYKKKLERFRKKWTENELTDVIKELNFQIINKVYRVDPYIKEKNWICLLARKT